MNLRKAVDRVGGFAFVGAVAALATGALTPLLALKVSVPAAFAVVLCGVFVAGYFAGRRDELRSLIKECRREQDRS